MRTTGTVDDWFMEQTGWAAEVAALRAIVKGCGLEEGLKWRQPCYMDEGQNIAIIGTLKEGCVISLLKGALLDDPAGLLVSPGENSRSVRYLRFGSLAEVEAMRAVIVDYVQRAVLVERSGQKVEKPAEEAPLVPEIDAQLAADPVLAEAFAALTPGRRRAYNIIVGGAKSSSARAARFTRFRPRILAGKGPNDCICGHSQRPPNCDGSHKLHGVEEGA